ncbi:YbaB/EbfC family nucleoid-associated protein, partial [Mycobacteroides abscessus]
RVQFELEQIRGTGVSGRIKVEVDAAGRLLSVRSPDGEAILEAYRQALAEAEAKAREVAQDVLNDPLATSVRGLLEANNAQLEADRRAKDEEDA